MSKKDEQELSGMVSDLMVDHWLKIPQSGHREAVCGCGERVWSHRDHVAAVIVREILVEVEGGRSNG